MTQLGEARRRPHAKQTAGTDRNDPARNASMQPAGARSQRGEQNTKGARRHAGAGVAGNPPETEKTRAGAAASAAGSATPTKVPTTQKALGAIPKTNTRWHTPDKDGVRGKTERWITKASERSLRPLMGKENIREEIEYFLEKELFLWKCRPTIRDEQMHGHRESSFLHSQALPVSDLQASCFEGETPTKKEKQRRNRRLREETAEALKGWIGQQVLIHGGIDCSLLSTQ